MSDQQKFTVFVDDNFHYQDEDERYTLGEFDTYDEALVACKKIVDDFLAQHLTEKPDRSSADLFKQYTGFGEDPFISPEPDLQKRFSAWTYAEHRCASLCENPS